MSGGRKWLTFQCQRTEHSVLSQTSIGTLENLERRATVRRLWAFYHSIKPLNKFETILMNVT